MLGLKERQRAALSETLRELANVAAGAMALGQFVGQQPLSWSLFLAGIVVWCALVGLGLLLAGERSNG